MKKCILFILLITCIGVSQLHSQQMSSLGLQWSSSRMGYSFPFEGFNMGSELSAFSYLRWGKYLIVAPEFGLRQHDQSFSRIGNDYTYIRFRSVHVKMSLLFPFRKSFHKQNRGWFASIGFSENLRFNIYEEKWVNDELISVINFFGDDTEGDLHIGLGYSRPIGNHLHLCIRAEYAEGFIGSSGFRRNELSLGVGLGLNLARKAGVK